VLAASAAGFFWLFAAHTLTGLLDFMAKGGVGTGSRMVGNIDVFINGALVVPLGKHLAAAVLFVAGIGMAWLVARTPRQHAGKEPRRDEAVPAIVPAPAIAPTKAGFGKRTAAPVRAAPDGQTRPARAAVWMSRVLSNYDIGMKQGTRTKFFNHEWDPASLNIPVEPDEVYAAYRRHTQGFALRRTDFPEATAVFDERRFARVKSIFYSGPFLTVEGNLARLFSRFDLGEGGLIPFTMYKSDLVTPLDREVFLLNFGARKNSILPDQCEDTRKFIVEKTSERQVYTINELNENGDVVLSYAALDGPDLWFEEAVHKMIFIKDAMAQALIEIGVADAFKLTPCRIEGDAG
jgi:hypothetical protein